MNFYLRISKIAFLSISVMIVLIALFLSKYDTWAIDLFYSLNVFSLIIVIDFMFYELYCPYINGRNHIVFCIFPIYRIQILILEIKWYLKRWEVLLFFLSILFYISYFYFNNNIKILPLLLLLSLYTIQFIYLICFIFIIKNFQSKKNLRVNIKNLTSLFISITIMLMILADRNDVIRQVFFINPFSCGFLSFLVSKETGITAIIIIFCLTVFLGLLVQKKFKEWPL